ncbi:MAG: YlqD family protein [Selenomonadaceae bacterium]|nr:YlqD family protein [Selenomonadaceae bacterium]MBP3721870.1 YlqD family protein [Selenomonadaceae bacterium]
MDSIKVTVPVTIKAKLTENLRKKLLENLANNLKQAEYEIQQLNLEEQRVLKEVNPDENTPEGHNELMAIRNHFEMERNKREEYRAGALEEKSTIEKLGLGAEIEQGTLDRQVEIKIGDDMRDVMNMEVLVEDDKVIAIRG